MTQISEEIKEKLVGRLEQMVDRRKELEGMLADPEFAGQSGRYAEVAKEHGRLGTFADIHRRLEEAGERRREAEELLSEIQEDDEMRELADDEIATARRAEKGALEELIDLFCSDPAHHQRNIIVEIRSGTGGEEAALFAGDLMRMYTRYADSKGWKTSVMDKNITDMGGFKHVILSIKGDGAWQRLRYESGGHRVQRVPETESQGRIHTSLATVAVLPEARDTEIELNPDELDISFMRSGGPGGQNVNKVASCVRIVHEPTGVTVKCQEEKSQHKNRRLAMKLLRTKLYERREQEQKQKRDQLRRTQVGSGDRNERVRTYNFPQDRVTDHRIGLDVFGIEKVLMGDLDAFIEALTDWDKEQRLEALS